MSSVLTREIMTTSRKNIVACAKSMTETCNIGRGECVLVRGGVHTQELLEEISLECYRRGAVPILTATSDRYAKAVYDEIPASTLATVPKHLVSAVKDTDTLIIVEELDDPSIADGFPRNKLVARQKANLPLLDIVYHPTKGKKWLYAGWPTEAASKRYDVPYADLEKFIIGGISVPPKTLMKIGQDLARRFKDARWVHVWDNKGTDFRVDISKRRVNIDDGFVSKSDYDVGDRGANLPAGEVFFAPKETVGEGTLYCPITQDRMSGKLVTDVHLEFKGGKLLTDKTTASSNADQLVASFRECEKIDREKFSPVRTANLAELGIGFNPKITRAIGYILTDEKICGTVHLAFGANKSYGGRSESVMHWDFVSAPGANIDVEKTNGRTRQVMRRGKLV
jgi:aminopeptidase